MDRWDALCSQAGQSPVQKRGQAVPSGSPHQHRPVQGLADQIARALTLFLAQARPCGENQELIDAIEAGRVPGVVHSLAGVSHPDLPGLPYSLIQERTQKHRQASQIISGLEHVTVTLADQVSERVEMGPGRLRLGEQNVRRYLEPDLVP